MNSTKTVTIFLTLLDNTLIIITLFLLSMLPHYFTVGLMYYSTIWCSGLNSLSSNPHHQNKLPKIEVGLECPHSEILSSPTACSLKSKHLGILKVEVLVTHSCPALCDPMDSSPAGSSVHGILQARIPEWVAIAFSRGTSQPRDRTWVSCISGRFFTIWATRKAHGIFRSQIFQSIREHRYHQIQASHVLK